MSFRPVSILHKGLEINEDEMNYDTNRVSGHEIENGECGYNEFNGSYRGSNRGSIAGNSIRDNSDAIMQKVSLFVKKTMVNGKDSSKKESSA